MKIIGNCLIIVIALMSTSCGLIDFDKVKDSLSSLITGDDDNQSEHREETNTRNSPTFSQENYPKVDDEANWSPGYISLYDFWYSFPSGYSSKKRTSDHGCHILTYDDGIEITVSGTWGGKDLLKELYQSAIGSNPVFKVYKNDWYVISDDNGDGTEYYTRSGVIVTHPDLTNNEASPIIATMTISYPISAKLHAQEFIQKYFKGFPKSHQN